MNIDSFAPYLLIYFAGHFVFSIWSFIIYDSILKLEYKSYHVYWKNDGQPIGFFWIARENRKLFVSPFSQLRNQFARDQLSRKWLYSTPEWMTNDPQALQLTTKYRWLISIWSIFYGAPILIIIIYLILFGLTSIKF
jgi:hypothetical protein